MINLLDEGGPQAERQDCLISAVPEDIFYFIPQTSTYHFIQAVDFLFLFIVCSNPTISNARSHPSQVVFFIATISVGKLQKSSLITTCSPYLSKLLTSLNHEFTSFISNIYKIQDNFCSNKYNALPHLLREHAFLSAHGLYDGGLLEFYLSIGDIVHRPVKETKGETMKLASD